MSHHYVPKGSSNHRDDGKVQELTRQLKMLIQHDEPVGKRLKAVQNMQKVVSATQAASSGAETAESAFLRSNFDKIFPSLRLLLVDKYGQTRPAVASLLTALGFLFAAQIRSSNVLLDSLFLAALPTDTTPSMPEKKALLSIIKDLTLSADGAQRAFLAGPVMVGLKTLLDAAVTEDFLTLVLDIIIAWWAGASIPAHQTMLFSQSMVRLHAAVLSFSAHWTSHASFAITLVSQLISDMQKIFDTSVPTAKQDEESDKKRGSAPKSAKSKASRVISQQVIRFATSFLSLWKSMGPPLRAVPPVATEAQAVLSRFLSFLRASIDLTKDEKWVLFANNLLVELAAAVTVLLQPLLPKICDVLTTSVNVSLGSRTHALNHIIGMHSRVVMSSSLPPASSTTQKYLHPDLLSLRMHPESAVVAALRALYSALLMIDIQGDGAQPIVSTFVEELSSILPKLNVSASSRALVDDLTRLACFNLSVLAQIRRPTNSQRLFFDTSFDNISRLCDCNPGRGVQSDPTLHIAAAEAVFAFAALSSTPPFSKPHYVRTLGACLHDTAASMLKGSALRHVSYLAQLKAWVDTRPVGIPDVIFQAILTLCNDPEVSIRLTSAQCLRALHAAQHLALTSKQTDSALACAIARTHDTSGAVQEAFSSAAADTAVSSSWPQQHSEEVQVSSGSLSVAAVKRLILNHIQTRDSPVSWGKKGELQLLFTHAFQGEQVDADWFIKQLSMCRSQDRQNTLSKASSMIELSHDLLVFWGLAESSQFWIVNRLRTHLGSPAQSLEALEKLAAKLMTDTQPEAQSPEMQQRASPQSVMYLFSFLDILERQIAFTADGSLLLGSSPASTATQSFFRANRKVCVDWFNRMRPKLMSLAHSVGLASSVLKQGFERLTYLARYTSAAISQAGAGTDMKLLKKETEQALAQVSTSLAEERDTDTLDGLYRWAKTSFKSHRLANGDIYRVELRWMPALIQQSRGRYERAAEVYSHLFEELNSEQLESLQESGLLQLLVDYAVHCFVALSDWEGYTTLVDKINLQNLPLQNARLRYTPAYVQALMEFDHGDFQASREKLGSVTDIQGGLLAHSLRLRRSEELSLHVMASLAESKITNDRVPEDLVKSIELANKLVSSQFSVMDCEQPRAARMQLIQTQAVRQIAEILGVKVDGVSALPLSAIFSHAPRMDSSSIDMNQWSLILRINRLRGILTLPTLESHSDVHKVIKLARKSGNFRMAERLNQEVQLLAETNVGTLFERCKLLQALNKPAQALVQLWQLSRNLSTSVDRSDEMNTKVYLKLARWLQLYEKQPTVIDVLAATVPALRAPRVPQHLQVEALIGSTLREATESAPQSSNAWYQYADWLYRNGHRITKQFSLQHSDYDAMISLLTPAEKSRLDLLIGRCAHFKSEESRREAFAAVVNKVLPRTVADTSSEETFAPMNKEDVVIKLFFSAVGVEDISLAREFLSIFADIRKRILSHHRLALESYIRFLQIHTIDVGREPSITATLRILRLLVKYGADLSTFDSNLSSSKGVTVSLSDKLSAMPVAPWRNVVPQLFARLGHKEEFVRSQVFSLLCRIGKEYPQDVIYAIVGGSSSDAAIVELIRSTLLEHSKDLLLQLESLVSELRRVALLPEEAVLTSLRDIQDDISSRVRTVRSEMSRQDASGDKYRQLFTDSYQTILRPAVSRLERLFKDICNFQFQAGREQGLVPTKHEQWFVSTYRDAVELCLQSVRNCPLSVDDLDFVVSPLRELVRELSKFTKRSSLRLESVSTKLHRGEIGVPIPGANLSDVLISGMDQLVPILPTKTKPKKLTMIGSDGNRYSFLLKGREDLHLDERIMQFVTTVNQLLRRNKSSASRSLRARHYSVIPLGRSSGLIQWVDGTSPLYSVYAEYQRRSTRSAPVQITSESESYPEGPSDNKTAVKPIDQFYSKLMPALKAAGIAQTNILSQSRPFEVLRKVYLELERETPRDLLERELWLSCSGAADWWQKTLTYSRSAAVMSIVGYIIGLGDRHLDNILVDFSSGELVHIDYNVCFEKGLKLRVPEVVPFRMTQIMQRALGVTGVDGSFRVASEHTLSVLRANRETLLTLLEAFVYDPVVDWTAADKMHDEERSMELDVAFTLLLSRAGASSDASMYKNFMDSTTALEPLLVEFTSSAETLASVLSSTAAAIQTKSAASSQRAQLQGELLRINDEIQKSTAEAKRILLEDGQAETHRSELASEIAAFVDDATLTLATTQTAFSSLLSDSPTSVLMPLPHTLTCDSLPRTLNSLANLKLSESFVARCKEKDLEMLGLIRSREDNYLALVDALKSYRQLIAEACPITSYMNSASIIQWLPVAKSLLEDKPDVSQIGSSVRRLADRQVVQGTMASDLSVLRSMSLVLSEAKATRQTLQARASEDSARATGAEQTLKHNKDAIYSFLTSLRHSEPTAPINILQVCVHQQISSFLGETDALAASSSLAAVDRCHAFYGMVDKAAFFSLLLGDCWAPLNAGLAAALSTSPLVAAQQSFFRLEQLFADLDRVVLPEASKAIAASDPSFLNCVGQLTDIAKLLSRGSGGFSLDPFETSSEWDLPPALLSSVLGDESASDRANSRSALSQYQTLSSMSPVATPDGNGHILLVACDKLFDSAIDAAGFGVLRDSLMEQPPFSQVFSNLEGPIAEMQKAKIRAISRLFSVNVSISGSSSPAVIADAVQAIKYDFISSCIQSLLCPTWKFVLRRFLTTFSPAATNVVVDPSSATLHGLLSRYAAAAAEYQRRTQAFSAVASLLQAQEEFIQRQQSELARFQLLHDSTLSQTELGDSAAVLSARSQLVAQFKSLSSSLTECATEISMCEQAYFSFETEVLRAVHSSGKQAMHQLGTSLKVFQEGVVGRRQAQRLISDKVNALIGLTNSISSFEVQRSVPTCEFPIAEVAVTFATNLEQAQSRSVMAQELSQRIVLLSQTREAVSKEITALEQTQKKQDTDKATGRLKISAQIQDDARALRNCLENYQALWGDLEPVFSSINRITDRWSAPGVSHIHANTKRIFTLVNQLAKLISPLIKIISWISGAPQDRYLGSSEMEHAIDDVLPSLRVWVDKEASDSFIALWERLQVAFLDAVKSGATWLQGGDIDDGDAESDDDTVAETVSLAESKQLSSSTASMRNQTAVSVLRRVKQKLEGSDGGSNGKQTITDQVDRIIKEAISVDNLSRMYEGWTSWI